MWGLLLDHRRAWIEWRRARDAADRLGVLYETALKSMERALVWKDVQVAALRCLHLRVPGPNWRRELEEAEARVETLET